MTDIIPKQTKWYGWVPDLPDSRDKLYKVSRRKKKSFPPKVDLSETIDNKFPIFDQGNLGSCFTGDTLVTMGDLTEKHIKNIDEGEMVSNQFGIPRQVTRKYKRNYTGELYKLKVKGLGHSLYLTEEHPIAIKYTIPIKSGNTCLLQDTIQYIQVKDIDLSKKPFVVIPKTKIIDPSKYIIDVRDLLEDELIYNEETQKIKVIGGRDKYSIPVKFELTGDFMRLLGLFLAEGSYRKDTSYNLQGINFTFDRKEQDLVEFVQNTILTIFGLNVEIKNTDRRKSITDVCIGNVTLARIFKKLCGEFSFGKQLSPLLFKQSRENKLQLLRGWIDGDGINTTRIRYKNINNQEIRPCQVEGVTISNRLVRDLYRLALTCDLKPSLSVKNNTKWGKVESYTLYFFGLDALELYPEFKQVIFNEGINIGRICSYRKDINNYYCKIQTIEKKYVENIPVYNLEVEKDNVYIANFCLVHNCTANAIGAALAIVNIKQDIQKMIDQNQYVFIDPSKIFTPSRLFIYYNEREMEGTTGEDSGAMIRDGIKSVNILGVCKEDIWTYDISRFTQKPSDPSYTEALFHQALKYERLDNTNINQLKNVLTNDGLPFVFGFTVYESFESDEVAKTGNMPMPSPTERVLGGHAVLCVGYDDTTKRFKVRNSWGNDWGDKGYFYMPYEYMTNPNLVDDAWLVSIVETSDQ